ncbi:uncharacterized protein LOC135397770 isoform X2 [Ornithodoros turicata]
MSCSCGCFVTVWMLLLLTPTSGGLSTSLLYSAENQTTRLMPSDDELDGPQHASMATWFTTAGFAARLIRDGLVCWAKMAEQNGVCKNKHEDLTSESVSEKCKSVCKLVSCYSKLFLVRCVVKDDDDDKIQNLLAPGACPSLCSGGGITAPASLVILCVTAFLVIPRWTTL